ncbi:MAG: carboxypeptidase-like regulatory domain-containing protein [Flavobacteriaceae bacterium]|nr:carboxypeptidase-like regulatory domain-containing protein [Flavobacteriaceae bacterium]
MKNLTYYIYRSIFALACTLPLASFAQQTISGIVSDENGLPLPGATVVVENTNRGTTTDFDGKYLINAQIGENLIFSYVGYTDQKIKVGNTIIIDVKLRPEGQLGEVVVTGFQKIDRKLFTGSADKVDMADAKLEGVADLSRALQGQVAGVDIENVSGTFGTAPQVRIRGNASINGTNRPLWVVDGVVLEDAVEISNEEAPNLHIYTSAGRVRAYVTYEVKDDEKVYFSLTGESNVDLSEGEIWHTILNPLLEIIIGSETGYFIENTGGLLSYSNNDTVTLINADHPKYAINYYDFN